MNKRLLTLLPFVGLLFSCNPSYTLEVFDKNYLIYDSTQIGDINYAKHACELTFTSYDSSIYKTYESSKLQARGGNIKVTSIGFITGYALIDEKPHFSEIIESTTTQSTCENIIALFNENISNYNIYYNNTLLHDIKI